MRTQTEVYPCLSAWGSSVEFYEEKRQVFKVDALTYFIPETASLSVNRIQHDSGVVYLWFFVEVDNY